MTFNLRKAFSTRIKPDDQVIIAGGGMAALFAAYELQRQARGIGRKLRVVVIAERFNAPCSAGSHLVQEHEGFFFNNLDNRLRLHLSRLLRHGQDGLERAIRRENIDCSLSRGYEWKSHSRAMLNDTISDTVGKQMYRNGEFDFAPDAQFFNLPGYGHSTHMECIGQVNMGKLVHALTEIIVRNGGQVVESARYISHEHDAGRYAVHTTNGTFLTPHKPIIATGAEHMHALLHHIPEFKISTDVVYTMCVAMKVEDPADRRRISPRPMAFSDTNLSGEVLWGGIDDRANLTMGRRHLVDNGPAQRAEGKKELARLIDAMYPGLADRYDAQLSIGPLLCADNHLPIVGRMKDCVVMGGWAGDGIVPAFAASMACGEWLVRGNDRNLRILESLQPSGTFIPSHRPQANTFEAAHLLQ